MMMIMMIHCSDPDHDCHVDDDDDDDGCCDMAFDGIESHCVRCI